MTKIVINTCYGGFSLNADALQLWASLQGIQTWVTKDKYNFERVITVPPDQIAEQPTEGGAWYALSDEEREESNHLYSAQHISVRSIARDDPFLVQVVEQLGTEAGASHSHLKVVEIPDDVEWELSDYDGIEHICEVHRTWS